jgi:uroporphyrinogen-III synthase
MRTALVTRPREDSEGVAAELRARGLAVMVEPLLDIRNLDGVAIDTEGVQGILATSANGVRALARALADRALPVWAVGDASARCARELGYTQVESAGGDVDTLTALVAERCDPAKGAFLHAAGTVVAGDLNGQLAEKGFQVRRVVLYEAVTAEALSYRLTGALTHGAVDVGLFFSPRTAATFVTLVQAAGLADSCKTVTAYALSPAVATALSPLTWRAVRIADAPTQAALLAALDDDLGETMTDEQPTQTPQPAPEADQKPAETAEEGKAAPWGILVGAVLALVLVAGAVVTWPQWKDQVMPPKAVTVQEPAAPEPDALRAELDQTRDRLARLEAQLAERPAGFDAGPLDARLAQVEQGLRALQNQPQLPARLADDVAALAKDVADLKRTSADAAAVLRLADRVDKTEAEMREMQARRSSATALLLAVGQLREAVNASMPFDAELRAVKTLAPQDADFAAALEALKGRAASGIPSRLMLAERFNVLAPDLVRAETLPAERNWWRDTLHRVSTLVTVRREDGDAAGTSAAAIAARIQARLSQNDLAGAATEAEQFQGGAAESVAPWLDDLRARAAADKALGELTAQVVAAIGPRQ